MNSASPRPTGRTATLAGGLVALAALGLLWALGAVVNQGVRQADARHADTAARADATWRCSNLAGRDNRDDCRQRASGALADVGEDGR